MRNKKIVQSVILIFILLVTGFMVKTTPSSVEIKKTRDLRTVFGPVKGYEIVNKIPLSDDIYRFLELDDYTTVSYAKAGDTVGLYIGYYYSLDKVSAAHSPLICFPGQGWTIDHPLMRSLEIDGHTVDYAEMVATLEEHQELVLYWYQAYEGTSPAVFKNKINAMINKFTRNKQEHAFVRVTVPFTHSDRENARQVAIEFIKAFYPTFLNYINDKGV